MKTIILTMFTQLGIKQAVLKLSFIFAFALTTASEVLAEKIPVNFLGVTIFLWIVYVSTVFLDWMTGVTAAKVEAKRNRIKFNWDLEKSITNVYKHALFIMIIATIYFFQKELSRKHFGEFIVTFLSYVQFAYFGYNMINEWISIEENRFRVNNKYSRLYKFLNRLLNIFDKAAISKIEKITNTKEDETTK